MAVARQQACAGCGQPRAAVVPPGAAPICRNSWCSRPQRPLSAVYSVGNYGGSLRRSIVAYKYGGDLRWARPFAALLRDFLLRHGPWFEEFEVICPVPSFPGPGRRRDWGHIELVCDEMQALDDGQWPVERLVAKSAETRSMSTQTREQRLHACAPGPGPYVAIGPVGLHGTKAVVVDDVCASGSTLLSVAAALRAAGAQEVVGLVIARAAWRL
jgi:predicted amidophosphoribosyltransferase